IWAVIVLFTPFLIHHASAAIAKLIPVIDRIDATFNEKYSNSSVTLVTEGPQGRRRFPDFTVSIQTFRPITDVVVRNGTNTPVFTTPNANIFLVKINTKITISTLNGRFSQPFLDTTVSLCDLMKNPQKYHVLALFLFEIRRYGPLPTCPVSANLYVFSNVSLKRMALPTFLSESNFFSEILAKIWTVIVLFTPCTIHTVSCLLSHKVIPILTRVDLQDNLKYLNSSVVVHNTPTETKVDLAITVKRPLPDPWINVIVWIDIASGTLQAPLHNQTFRFCDFLRNPGMSRIGQILHREVKRYGKIPTCPIALELYQYCGISTGAIRLPTFLPEANYIMHVFLGVGKEIVYDSRWHGTLKHLRCTGSMRC
uniref:Uncharacterized protein n=1 Tax=Anopheles epiroticus TaxID=199890 RepID=A0A182NZW8_9DIPT